jgi:hypothetical protein
VPASSAAGFLGDMPRVVYLSQLNSRGSQDSATEWAVKFQPSSAYRDSIQAKMTAQQHTVVSLVKHSLCVGACLFNGELPRQYNPSPEVCAFELEKPLVWRVDPTELEDGVPAELTLFIDRRTLPLSARSGEAPMRLVALTTNDGCQDVCWTPSFEVRAKQKKHDAASVLRPARSRDAARCRLVDMAQGDIGMVKLEQLLRSEVRQAIQVSWPLSGGTLPLGRPVTAQYYEPYELHAEYEPYELHSEFEDLFP